MYMVKSIIVDEINTLNDKEPIDVSIWRATFKQCLYIEDALKGFISQEGSVRFEVVVFVHLL